MRPTLLLFLLQFLFSPGSNAVPLQPHPIYTPDRGSIGALQIQRSGRLSLLIEGGRKGQPSSYEHLVLEPTKGRITSRKTIGFQQSLWAFGRSADSRLGWTVVAPPPNGLAGDRVFGGHGDSDEDYSLNWLRLVSPSGKIKVLKRLPQFFKLQDLRFSPNGDEVLALTSNALWRYNIKTGVAKQVARPGAGKLTSEIVSRKRPAETWANSDDGDYSGGAALSPDGKTIFGYHSKIVRSDLVGGETGVDWKVSYNVFVVYDARTGRIVQRISAPLEMDIDPDSSRVFQARFTEDGKYILLEGPSWKKVICMRWKDKKPLSRFVWTHRIYRSYEEPPPVIRSQNGYYFCEPKGNDIEVRSVLTGQVVSRALDVLDSERGNNDDLGNVVMAPDLTTLYLQPIRSRMLSRSLWAWPLIRPQK